MTNRILNSKAVASAFRRAAALLANRGRLLNLLRKFGQKLLTLERPREEVRLLIENWKAAARLLRAYVRGAYRNVAAKSLIAMAAGIAYFVNPIDVIPDFIPLTGFVDDFSFMLWVYHLVEGEIRKFREWEQLQEG